MRVSESAHPPPPGRSNPRAQPLLFHRRPLGWAPSRPPTPRPWARRPCPSPRPRHAPARIPTHHHCHHHHHHHPRPHGPPWSAPLPLAEHATWAHVTDRHARCAKRLLPLRCCRRSLPRASSSWSSSPSLVLPAKREDYNVPRDRKCIIVLAGFSLLPDFVENHERGVEVDQQKCD
ncbi:E3 SUMO-protein ligase CBX4-like [Macrobrachium nipponense]|uniref:E3 SUMO-protein ligase CBX4-like n=1 Tax=Macrobrachium nipponense TaxID=159736 RepID=UPI0030C823A7